VIEIRVDRLLEEWRVAGLPATNDQTLGDDPVGRVAQYSSSFRTAFATRCAEGM
jgi:hypothetical protein